MFTSRSEPLSNGRVIKYFIENNSSPLSFADANYGWQKDPGFRAFFIELLLNSPYPVFRWETPAVTAATVYQAFEFVLVDSPEIALAPDPAPFSEHFATADPEGVIEFPNLGGDAILVAPLPGDPLPDYGHLASFLRNSPESQQNLLWKSVGAAMQSRISSRPVWLNTAGGGVAWLHVRLDDRPKYYAYADYRAVPGA